MATLKDPPESYSDINSYFDNEWLCPYCTAPTRSLDRICPACRRPLIIRKRVKEERTVWLWRGIFLEIVVIFMLVSLGTAYFALAVKLNGIPSPVPFLPLYFGQSVDQPPDLIQAVLTVLPWWAFWGIIGIALYSFVLMALLYVRVPYGHFIYLVNSGMMLVLGLFGAIFFHNGSALLVMWVLLVFLGLGQLLVTLNLWNDFTFKEGRLNLRIDRGAKNHRSLFISASKYSKLGMWGLAIIHLQRAIGRDPNILAYHLALVVAYMNIKRYHLADKALSNAEKLGSTLEVLRLRRRLNTLLKNS